MDTIKKIMSMLSERNISQKELAEHIGVSEQKFSDWKSGRIKSYRKYLPQIAEYFNVSTDYLLGNSEQKEKPIVNNNDERKLKFSTTLDSLSPEALERVYSYARFLLDEEEKEQKK